MSDGDAAQLLRECVAHVEAALDIVQRRLPYVLAVDVLPSGSAEARGDARTYLLSTRAILRDLERR